MANHKSKIKRHKQSLKAAARNRSNRTRVKNVVKNVREAIHSKQLEGIDQTLSNANSVIFKASSKGAIHWKTAARKVSRLAKAVNRMKAENA